jgi:exopolyphosphatase/guanosine-5'-triphosphate,3'-diphosphate pyrophosphatase
MAPVRTGLIDIGATAVRLLVADVEEGSLSPVLDRRHDVRPRRGTEPALAALAGAEAARARGSGAERVIVAAGASLRRYAELQRLDRACRREGAGAVMVLAPGQECRLAFRGATSAAAATGPVAAVLVGGASTGIAVGWPGTDPDWWGSRSVGPRLLAERIGAEDSPTAAQLAGVRAAAGRALATLAAPECERAYVAGDAAGYGSAALVIVDEVRDLLGRRLEPARGGLAEGLALGLADEAAFAAGGP